MFSSTLRQTFAVTSNDRTFYHIREVHSSGFLEKVVGEHYLTSALLVFDNVLFQPADLVS